MQDRGICTKLLTGVSDYGLVYNVTCRPLRRRGSHGPVYNRSIDPQLD